MRTIGPRGVCLALFVLLTVHYLVLTFFGYVGEYMHCSGVRCMGLMCETILASYQSSQRPGGAAPAIYLTYTPDMVTIMPVILVLDRPHTSKEGSRRWMTRSWTRASPKTSSQSKLLPSRSPKRSARSMQSRQISADAHFALLAVQRA